MSPSTATSSSSSCSSRSASPTTFIGNGSSTSNGVGIAGKNYIEHRVSKMDTLAGVAIKYGVEVADIKRMNGLATDLQMFALKTLQIPLPGRHPPSPCLSNGSTSRGETSTEKSPSDLGQSNLLEPIQSLRLKPPKKNVSPAMSTLQKYYGLRSSYPRGAAEGTETEMAVYNAVGSEFLDDRLLPKASPFPDLVDHHRKSAKFNNGFMPENGAAADYLILSEAGDGESEKSDEKSMRRRSKAEVDFVGGTPERTLKGENSVGSGGFSGSAGKRPKSASRSVLQSDTESAWLNPIPVGLGDSFIADGTVSVRKSSSTSSLKDQENSNSSSVWPTSRWSLKSDLQALSTAAITIPIFDGLPKPITGRRKAALD
ncbi:hypothetical protein FEM48_Zijuj05G0179600 [Ziziphus jujuba var. spinosa]|uniref:LysM domain-containing protein n=1 Tax=Ziziphus jujuba var. spinosa TaxID=714518 RepID=A0A978VGA5_ZIZJJ|nr:hypothetical protein FEM48_Zijuj05G0179600 [Ziziphus jujuba var. spinosa]